jgi:hypothetical protein
MNNERYEQIIDEVYDQFRKYKMENLYDTQWDVIMEMNVSDRNKPYFVTGRSLTKEEFINKIKTNQEFSERWGLKIEKRELEFQERLNILGKQHPLYFMQQQLGGEDILTRNNIPTKLITITYKNETIEVYE